MTNITDVKKFNISTITHNLVLLFSILGGYFLIRISQLRIIFDIKI